MKTTHIEIKPLTWIAPEFSVASTCDLDIYAGEAGCLILVTEREDNKGMGLSCIEGPACIAETLYRWYGYEPESMTWIEYLPETDAYAQVALRCTDHRVDEWTRTPCSRAAVMAMVAEYSV